MTTVAADPVPGAAHVQAQSQRRSRRVPVADVVLASGISVLGVLMVTGDDRFGPAALGMLLLGLPLLLRSRQPTIALLALVLGTWANGGLFGDRVRCGALVPALALLSFAAARHAAPRRRAVPVALAFLVLAGEFVSDPIARGGGLPDFVALAAAAVGLGFLAHRRDAVLAQLEQQELRLRGAREETVRAAAEAERLRVGTGLAAVIDPQIRDIEASASAGLADPAAAAAALQHIEDTARSAIVEIRTKLLTIRSGDP